MHLTIWNPKSPTRPMVYQRILTRVLSDLIFHTHTCQSESCHPLAYDKDPPDHTGDSDNSNSFWHHSDITNGRNIFLEGILIVKPNGKVGILTNLFSIRILGSAGGHRIQVDRCIIFNTHGLMHFDKLKQFNKKHFAENNEITLIQTSQSFIYFVGSLIYNRKQQFMVATEYYKIIWLFTDQN